MEAEGAEDHRDDQREQQQRPGQGTRLALARRPRRRR
jgi:hypothetical protein